MPRQNMDSTNGWVALPRSIWDSPIATKKDYLLVWLYIYSNVNHTENSFIWNNSTITVKRGQGIFSQLAISKKLKVNIASVSRILKYLENEKQIEKQTTTKYTLITILNYDRLSESVKPIVKQTKNKLKTNEKQTKTNNNDNNEYNKDKNIINNRSVAPDRDNTAKPFEERYRRFIEGFNLLTGKSYRGDMKSKRQLKSRLEEGYSPDDFTQAMKNAMQDDYLNGKNDNGRCYLTPEYITRQDKLEYWINNKPEKKVYK